MTISYSSLITVGVAIDTLASIDLLYAIKCTLRRGAPSIIMDSAFRNDRHLFTRIYVSGLPRFKAW